MPPTLPHPDLLNKPCLPLDQVELMTGKGVSFGELIVPYQKISNPMDGHWKFQGCMYVRERRGGGVSEAKIMVRKESMKLNGYFWKGEGEGFKQTNEKKKKEKGKRHPWREGGGMDIFGNHSLY